MKVIETIRNNLNGTEFESSWGNVIDNDLDVLLTVTQILRHQRDRDAVHTAAGRFQTVAIRIEL